MKMLFIVMVMIAGSVHAQVDVDYTLIPPCEDCVDLYDGTMGGVQGITGLTDLNGDGEITTFDVVRITQLFFEYDVDGNGLSFGEIQNAATSGNPESEAWAAIIQNYNIVINGFVLGGTFTAQDLYSLTTCVKANFILLSCGDFDPVVGGPSGPVRDIGSRPVPQIGGQFGQQ